MQIYEEIEDVFEFVKYDNLLKPVKDALGTQH